jgi:hypothetical protein
MGKFSITGEFLTEKIRDLWESKDFKKSVKLGLESLEGSKLSDIMSIIDGNMKLSGVNDLELVIDEKYKPHFSFLDILDYAMIPNNGYFRIYDEDTYTANKIIDFFDNTYPDSNGDNKREDYIRQWNRLLPEVRLDNISRASHWMLVYLRQFSNDLDVKKKANFYSINIVESEATVELTRNEFDKICDRYIIHGDREETWEQTLSNRKSIVEPVDSIIHKNNKEEFHKYKSDISMKSDYGWLSPDGRFTVCKWAEHEVLASLMCNYFHYPFTKEQEYGKQLSDVLLKVGYVKIHRDDIGFLHFTHLRKLTQEQELKLDRYKAIHGIK